MTKINSTEESEMPERRRYRDRIVDDDWGLRTDRAQRAFGLFCLSWIDASRQLGFGSAYLALNTAEDLSRGLCAGPERDVEVRRTDTPAGTPASRGDDARVVEAKVVSTDKVKRRQPGA
jgi:hypothetical protein